MREHHRPLTLDLRNTIIKWLTPRLPTNWHIARGTNHGYDFNIHRPKTEQLQGNQPIYVWLCIYDSLSAQIIYYPSIPALDENGEYQYDYQQDDFNIELEDPQAFAKLQTWITDNLNSIINNDHTISNPPSSQSPTEHQPEVCIRNC